jgi:hypothetical protein
MAEPVPEVFEEFLKNREVLRARSEDASQTQKDFFSVIEIDQSEGCDRVNRL